VESFKSSAKMMSKAIHCPCEMTSITDESNDKAQTLKAYHKTKTGMATEQTQLLQPILLMQKKQKKNMSSPE